MPRRAADEHLHQYDDKWQCKCGFRLIMEIDEKTGRMRVKACMTPDGKTLPMGDKTEEKKSTTRKAQRTP
jgi:hypothetical protein